MKSSVKSPLWDRLMGAMRTSGRPQTQTAVGKLAGVGQTSARKWMLGGYPEMETAVKLATKLGVCVEWLLTGRGARRPIGADDDLLAELVALWPHIEPDKRDELVRFAKYQRTISRVS